MIQKEMPPDQGEPETDGRFFAELKSCPVLCHSERTLLLMPWSSAFRPVGRSLEAIDPEGARWSVSAGPAGLPSSFDHGVFRTCEWIALEGVVSRGGALARSVIVRARDLCERLHLKEIPASARALERSLLRLAQVRIRQGHAGPGELRRKLLTEVIAIREEGSTRALDVSYRLTFDPAHVWSVQAGRTLPLNWRTWNYLRGPAARRIMEILTCAFASSPRAGLVQLPARQLAALVPIRRPVGPTLRAALEQAHEELLETKFIQAARWIPAKSEPLVVYEAGPSQRSVLDRIRPSRSASLLAWEIASELTDAADAGAYQELVERTDPRHLLAALAEIRILRKQGLSIPDARSFFLGRLKQSMERECRAQRPAVS